jgi:hypothetical protein
MERVEGCCPRGGEEEGGSGCNKLWRGRGGRQGLGRRGGAPIHRIEINGPNSLSDLSSRPQRKKMPKDLLFPEECLLKLQTPMPQNNKKKKKEV